MLKILEEPPSYLSFHLITSNPHRVLPTILSRCHRTHHISNQPGDAVSHVGNNLFEQLQDIKTAAKEENFSDYLLAKERYLIANGQWQEARTIDKILNLHNTSNANATLALENAAIAQKAHIDTPQK